MPRDAVRGNRAGFGTAQPCPTRRVRHRIASPKAHARGCDRIRHAAGVPYEGPHKPASPVSSKLVLDSWTVCVDAAGR
jgi:hypothetical protein